MNIKLTFNVILFMFFSDIVLPQVDVSFNPLSDMTSSRYGMGYTFDSVYIYAIEGGIDISPWISTTMERYDIINDYWSEFVTGLIPRRYTSAEFVSSQGKIYIFNGYSFNGSAYTDTIEIVDVNSGELTYNNSNPYPVEHGGSAVWDGKIYIFGGSNSGVYSNRLYEFNPATFDWIRLPDMPESKQTSGRIVDGKLYVFGGYHGSVSSRIDVYDIQNGSWSFVGYLSSGISAHATTVSGNKIWLVGDYTNFQSLGVFDTASLIFYPLTNNMIGRRHAGTITFDNNLYIFGGNQDSLSTSALNSLQYADISNFTVSVPNINDKYPASFKVFQNYPNPFNPTTKIKYEIPKTSFVIIKVYNVLGKQVAALVNEEKSAGNYEINFDASELASGIYFYCINAGSFTDTKKMILLR